MHCNGSPFIWKQQKRTTEVKKTRGVLEIGFLVKEDCTCLQHSRHMHGWSHQKRSPDGLSAQQRDRFKTTRRVANIGFSVQEGTHLCHLFCHSTGWGEVLTDSVFSTTAGSVNPWIFACDGNADPEEFQQGDGRQQGGAEVIRPDNRDTTYCIDAAGYAEVEKALAL